MTSLQTRNSRKAQDPSDGIEFENIAVILKYFLFLSYVLYNILTTKHVVTSVKHKIYKDIFFSPCHSKDKPLRLLSNAEESLQVQ